MQPERELDDVRDAFAGRAIALLVLERVGVAACGQEALLEMALADDAEMLRGDRLGMLAHRGQQLGDAGAVDLLDTEEPSQRLMRAADILEHLALDGTAGHSTELGDELSHRAIPPQITVAGHMRGEVTLQPCLVVPMRAGRLTRAPFLPGGARRL